MFMGEFKVQLCPESVDLPWTSIVCVRFYGSHHRGWRGLSY